MTLNTINNVVGLIHDETWAMENRIRYVLGGGERASICELVFLQDGHNSVHEWTCFTFI